MRTYGVIPGVQPVEIRTSGNEQTVPVGQMAITIHLGLLVRWMVRLNTDKSKTNQHIKIFVFVAYPVGKKISYDGDKGVVTDSDEANALLKRKYREGWTLDG